MIRKLSCLALVLVLAVGVAAASERWLHVRVQGDHGETVKINVPLSMARAMLSMIQTDEFHGGRISLDHADLGEIDLRQMLTALRDAPDAEYVTVRDGDESVRVAKEGDFLLVNAEEDDGRIRVRVPMEVVEALVSSGSNELDLAAALDALAKYTDGDLVTIEGDDESVRVWIDDDESGD